MSHIVATATLSSTGLKTFNLGFQPEWLHITVCERISGDNVAHYSSGKATAIKQFCQSTFADGTGGDSFNSAAHIVQHYERVSGTITKVLSASFDSFTATGIKLNVDIANNNYQVLIEAGD